MAHARRVTLQDIAAAVGLSVNTVSRALTGKDQVSEETRAMIKAVADRLGYVPNTMARSLVLGQVMTIGVVITNPSNPFYARLISAIEQRGRVHGYSMLLMVSEENPDNERRAVESMMRWGVDGAIVVPVQAGDDHWRRLIDSGTRVVLVNRDLSDVDCDFAGIDYERSAYEASLHLLDTGVDSMYLFEEDLRISTVAARIDGFTRAVTERGLPADAVRVLRVPTRRHEASTLPWEAAESYDLARSVVAGLPDNCGILLGNDYFALGLYRALREAGRRIPDDVRIVGFGDDTFAGYLDPALSSVRLPSEQLGTAAVDQLLARLADRATRTPRVTAFYPTELVVRASSAGPAVVPAPAPAARRTRARTRQGSS
ncbi:LacI family DNA-binding transcriptional regulator [Dactylosporangium sp. AC04546]|uniref:LacI family DNA-binding transcriptional regulator n=1 Tax=Dactylosporangium sp. AC04546 TaxID=2862460 RepID=UPI001EDF3346|nr:LacI family DNA-binding transcriptional regulator [Dactylosporangium sp. AC04546]WVK87089.1 LacI family DNA-binding transcriptional regulator [Dactylosporangium sp. AC04546]